MPYSENMSERAGKKRKTESKGPAQDVTKKLETLRNEFQETITDPSQLAKFKEIQDLSKMKDFLRGAQISKLKGAIDREREEVKTLTQALQKRKSESDSKIKEVQTELKTQTSLCAKKVQEAKSEAEYRWRKEEKRQQERHERLQNQKDKLIKSLEEKLKAAETSETNAKQELDDERRKLKNKENELQSRFDEMKRNAKNREDIIAKQVKLRLDAEKSKYEAKKAKAQSLLEAKLEYWQNKYNDAEFNLKKATAKVEIDAINLSERYKREYKEAQIELNRTLESDKARLQQKYDNAAEELKRQKSDNKSKLVAQSTQLKNEFELVKKNMALEEKKKLDEIQKKYELANQALVNKKEEFERRRREVQVAFVQQLENLKQSYKGREQRAQIETLETKLKTNQYRAKLESDLREAKANLKSKVSDAQSKLRKALDEYKLKVEKKLTRYDELKKRLEGSVKLRQDNCKELERKYEQLDRNFRKLSTDLEKCEMQLGSSKLALELATQTSKQTLLEKNGRIDELSRLYRQAREDLKVAKNELRVCEQDFKDVANKLTATEKKLEKRKQAEDKALQKIFLGARAFEGAGGIASGNQEALAAARLAYERVEEQQTKINVLQAELSRRRIVASYQYERVLGILSKAWPRQDKDQLKQVAEVLTGSVPAPEEKKHAPTSSSAPLSGSKTGSRGPLLVTRDEWGAMEVDVPMGDHVATEAKFDDAEIRDLANIGSDETPFVYESGEPEDMIKTLEREVRKLSAEVKTERFKAGVYRDLVASVEIALDVTQKIEKLKQELRNAPNDVSGIQSIRVQLLGVQPAGSQLEQKELPIVRSYENAENQLRSQLRAIAQVDVENDVKVARELIKTRSANTFNIVKQLQAEIKENAKWINNDRFIGALREWAAYSFVLVDDVLRRYVNLQRDIATRASDLDPWPTSRRLYRVEEIQELEVKERDGIVKGMRTSKSRFTKEVKEGLQRDKVAVRAVNEAIKAVIQPEGGDMKNLSQPLQELIVAANKALESKTMQFAQIEEAKEPVEKLEEAVKALKARYQPPKQPITLPTRFGDARAELDMRSILDLISVEYEDVDAIADAFDASQNAIRAFLQIGGADNQMLIKQADAQVNNARKIADAELNSLRALLKSERSEIKKLKTELKELKDRQRNVDKRVVKIIGLANSLAISNYDAMSIVLQRVLSSPLVLKTFGSQPQAYETLWAVGKQFANAVRVDIGLLREELKRRLQTMVSIYDPNIDAGTSEEFHRTRFQVLETRFQALREQLARSKYSKSVADRRLIQFQKQTKAASSQLRRLPVGQGSAVEADVQVVQFDDASDAWKKFSLAANRIAGAAFVPQSQILHEVFVGETTSTTDLEIKKAAIEQALQTMSQSSAPLFAGKFTAKKPTMDFQSFMKQQPTLQNRGEGKASVEIKSASQPGSVEIEAEDTATALPATDSLPMQGITYQQPQSRQSTYLARRLTTLESRLQGAQRIRDEFEALGTSEERSEKILEFLKPAALSAIEQTMMLITNSTHRHLGTARLWDLLTGPGVSPVFCLAVGRRFRANLTYRETRGTEPQKFKRAAAEFSEAVRYILKHYTVLGNRIVKI